MIPRTPAVVRAHQFASLLARFVPVRAIPALGWLVGAVHGLRRDDAARFAFLMGIPIIAGAGAWKTREIIASPPPSDEIGALVAGMIAAAISGLFAIRFLLRYLRSNSTGIFIVYRLGFAALVAVLLLLR